MSTTADKREALEREYGRDVAEIRFTPGLSWEKRERAVRERGLRYERDRKQLEKETA